MTPDQPFLISFFHLWVLSIEYSFSNMMSNVAFVLVLSLLIFFGVAMRKWTHGPRELTSLAYTAIQSEGTSPRDVLLETIRPMGEGVGQRV